MLFNSIEFAIFLPLIFLLYWFVFNRNVKMQNAFVVIVSYIFYGWWDWRFLLLIAFTSLCSWYSGILIEKYREKPRKARFVNISNIVINLLILCIFKYYNFFIATFADVFLGGKHEELLLNIILPVGISFYTFQALSYSIDVYRNRLKATRDIVSFFAFVSFFPQLVAGPIERATNLLPQFAQKRKFEYHTAVDGLRQILWGLFKKVVVADNCAVYVDNIFGNIEIQNGSTLFFGALMFTIQIYGDFSGYSDIAIGTAKLFGIKLMRNFNVPYFSRDIAEFWRRWHISLTTWFRDYVYIPLGGSRVSKAKVIRNTFVIFLLSGFWHGANWTFILWGAYHAILFLPLILLGKNRRYTNIVAENNTLPSPKEFLQMLTTFVLALFGWIIFRAENMNQLFDFVCGMFDTSFFEAPFISKKALFFSIVMLIVEWFQRKKEHALDLSNLHHAWLRIGIYYILAFLIILYFGGEQTFIYFQF